MSDFWEKNKGSITSGLKTAGKYGYQGTKYVAKTGYKASKTAGSRRQKGKGRRNKDEEDEEEDEVDEEKSNHNYNQTPPYGQYGGAQGYAGPPQQYQQSYQQPPQPYQQASQQYQSYPQPYQQQYQQPPQQYQQQQLQQQQQPLQYQQQQQQPLQYQQQQQQPLQYQQAYQQPYQAPLQYPQPYQSQQPQQVSSGYPNQAVVQPSINTNFPPQPQPQPFQPGVDAPPFTRQRAASPPLPSRSSNPMTPMNNGVDSSLISGSPVPGVIPYDKEQAEERKRLERVHIPEVDVTALPPPPTHKDRGTPDLKESRTASPQPTQAAMHVARSDTSIPEVAGQEEAPHVASDPPVSNNASTHPAEKASSTATETMVQREVRTSVSSNGHVSSDEKPVAGITGEFNYTVEVNYAPPPRPHRNQESPSPAMHTKPRLSSTPSGRSLPNRSTAAPRPPTLPSRQNSQVRTPSDVPTGEAFEPPVTNFLPPPRPFRSTDSAPAGLPKQASNQDETSESVDSLPSPPVRELASFPAPPKPKRWNTGDSTALKEEKLPNEIGTSTPAPRARGRLGSVNSQQIPSATVTSNASLAKKSPPPVLKPKPKILSAADQPNGSYLLEEEVHLPVNNEMGDISEELSRFKLKKTGSSYLRDGNDAESYDSSTTGSKIPPKIPPKKDALKKAPPIPAKSSSLKSGFRNQENQSSTSEDTNPFSVYLKSAVPSENNRLHR